MNKTVERFSDEYAFLSNLYPYKKNLQGKICRFIVKYQNHNFDCVECAYQAAKCKNPDDMLIYQRLNGSEAKKFADTLPFTIREDWAEIKWNVMYDLVWQKFSQNEPLRAQLLATKNAEIIEGNTWGDVYWGICEGKGENHLGKILMKIREKLLKQE